MANHPWYKLAVWHNGLRPAKLSREPLCEWHRKSGMIVPATVVHHTVPHRGNWELFSDPANLTSLCKTCHDSIAQANEKRGFDNAVSSNGWPEDPAHPFNRKR